MWPCRVGVKGRHKHYYNKVRGGEGPFRNPPGPRAHYVRPEKGYQKRQIFMEEVWHSIGMWLNLLKLNMGKVLYDLCGYLEWMPRFLWWLIKKDEELLNINFSTLLIYFSLCDIYDLIILNGLECLIALFGIKFIQQQLSYDTSYESWINEKPSGDDKRRSHKIKRIEIRFIIYFTNRNHVCNYTDKHTVILQYN